MSSHLARESVLVARTGRCFSKQVNFWGCIPYGVRDAAPLLLKEVLAKSQRLAVNGFESLSGKLPLAEQKL
jgi:hypothetical protein